MNNLRFKISIEGYDKCWCYIEPDYDATGDEGVQWYCIFYNNHSGGLTSVPAARRKTREEVVDTAIHLLTNAKMNGLIRQIDDLQTEIGDLNESRGNT